jgi:hypothetical protein
MAIPFFLSGSFFPLCLGSFGVVLIIRALKPTWFARHIEAQLVAGIPYKRTESLARWLAAALIGIVISAGGSLAYKSYSPSKPDLTSAMLNGFRDILRAEMKKGDTKLTDRPSLDTKESDKADHLTTPLNSPSIGTNNFIVDQLELSVGFELGEELMLNLPSIQLHGNMRSFLWRRGVPDSEGEQVWRDTLGRVFLCAEDADGVAVESGIELPFTSRPGPGISLFLHNWIIDEKCRLQAFLFSSVAKQHTIPLDGVFFDLPAGNEKTLNIRIDLSADGVRVLFPDALPRLNDLNPSTDEVFDGHSVCRDRKLVLLANPNDANQRLQANVACNPSWYGQNVNRLTGSLVPRRIYISAKAAIEPSAPDIFSHIYLYERVKQETSNSIIERWYRKASRTSPKKTMK